MIRIRESACTGRIEEYPTASIRNMRVSSKAVTKLGTDRSVFRLDHARCLILEAPDLGKVRNEMLMRPGLEIVGDGRLDASRQQGTYTEYLRQHPPALPKC
jgi:hypothetical protein